MLHFYKVILIVLMFFVLVAATTKVGTRTSTSLKTSGGGGVCDPGYTELIGSDSNAIKDSTGSAICLPE